MVDVNLTVDRMHSRLNVPAGTQNPAFVRSRFDRIARSDLPDMCRQVLDNLPLDDGEVYRIRHLHLHLWLAPSDLDDQQIARQWAQALRRAIAEAIRRGRSHQVRRYATSLQFVTEFVRDLLAGHAWNRWYYDEFRALSSLPISQVALQMILPRPHWIRPLLASLREIGAHERLLNQWGSDDIDQIWQVLGIHADPSTLDVQASIRLLSQVAPSLAEAPRTFQTDGEARSREVLRLWLHINEQAPLLADHASMAALLTLLVSMAALAQAIPDVIPLLSMKTPLYPAFRSRIDTSALSDTLTWLSALAASSQGRDLLAAAAEFTDAHGPTRTIRVATSDAIELPSQPVPPIDAIELPSQPAPSMDAVELSLPQATPIASPVGGVVVLLPALIDSGIWQHWIREDGRELACNYLYVLFLKAIGSDTMPLYLGDWFLTTLAGLDEPPMADNSRPQLPEVLTPEWTHALQSPEPGHDTVSVSAQDWQITRDMNAGVWFDASPDNLTIAGARRPLSHDELALIESEVKYLRLSRRPGYDWLTPRRDAALSVVASQVIRRMVRPFRGMSESSIDYIGAQFIRQTASMILDAGELHVRYSGSPLSIIVQMAGLPEYLDPPWLPYRVRLTIA